MRFFTKRLRFLSVLSFGNAISLVPRTFFVMIRKTNVFEFCYNLKIYFLVVELIFYCLFS